MGPAALAVLPALVGGAVKGIGNLFGGGGMTGKSARVNQVPTYDKQSIDNLHWLQDQGRQNADFSGISNREIGRFNRETIPSIAQRFTSAFGGVGGQRSSGFQQALGMAGSDLGERLAALRSQYGLQQMGMGLRPTFENQYMPRKPGALEGFAEGFSNQIPDMMRSDAFQNLLGNKPSVKNDIAKKETATTQGMQYGNDHVSEGFEGMGYNQENPYAQQPQIPGYGFTPMTGSYIGNSSNPYGSSGRGYGQIDINQISRQLPVLSRLQAMNNPYDNRSQSTLQPLSKNYNALGYSAMY